MYFFEGVKEKCILGIFEKLTVCFDLVPKSLYLFVSDSAELYSAELRSIWLWLDKDSSVPEGRFKKFLKIRSSVLNLAFLSFVGRFLYWIKKTYFFYNDLGVWGVGHKWVGIFLDA